MFDWLATRMQQLLSSGLARGVYTGTLGAEKATRQGPLSEFSVFDVARRNQAVFRVSGGKKVMEESVFSIKHRVLFVFLRTRGASLSKVMTPA